MSTRRLPNSHTTRKIVLTKASFKGNSTPPAQHPIPATLWAKLNLTNGASLASIYIAALTDVDEAEQALSASTELTEPRRDTLLQLCSHFFQVSDLAIARGVWPASFREYHHRDKNDPTLPDLRSYDDAIIQAGYILTGEANRAADDGATHTDMALPHTGEIAAALTALNAALSPHTALKDALKDRQQEAEALLPGPAGIERLILDHYDETEHTHRHLPDTARRDKCREWGLIYEGDPEDVDVASSSSSSSSSSSTGSD